MINYEILHSNYQQAEKDYISFYKGESWKKDYMNFSSKVKYKKSPPTLGQDTEKILIKFLKSQINEQCYLE